MGQVGQGLLAHITEMSLEAVSCIKFTLYNSGLFSYLKI